MRQSIIAVLAAVLLTACATVTPIAYSPNPGRIANPQEEVRSIILANVVQGCIAEPEFTSATMLSVKFVCSGGVGNSVARLDRVQGITLEESGGWYRVLVKHSAGAADFAWTSRSLQDMERLADAFTALSAGGSPAVTTTSASDAADL
jgi:hypothetical protein